MELLAVKNVSHTTDGGFVRAVIETDGEDVELVSTPDNLTVILGNLAAAVRDARKSQPDSTIVSAAQPVRYGTRPTKDRKAILLRFEMSNGLDHLFALPATDARVFQSQIDAACSHCGV